MSAGCFVTFEGPEGAGKTTAIRTVATQLESEGREVLVTREPGAGRFGASVRQLLLDGEALDPLAELFLFLADRAQHIERVVRPGLARGAVVLCDRHADSTVVYQGYGRSLDPAQLRDLNRLATRGLRPDLTLLLDLPAEVGLARRAEGRNRLDEEPLEFHRRVRDGYLAEAAREPDRWQIVDAALPEERVAEACLAAVRGRLR